MEKLFGNVEFMKIKIGGSMSDWRNAGLKPLAAIALAVTSTVAPQFPQISASAILGRCPELSLSAEQRRALELLGGHGNGCTEDLLVAHGFSRALVAELILAGLASATIERVMAGRKAVEVRRIRISDAGRQVL